MGAILGLLGALAAIIWVAARLLNAAADGKAAVRKMQWSNKSTRRMIEGVDDPRDAATILLVQTANYAGPLDDDVKAVIIQQLMSAFGADHDTAEGFLASAHYVLSEISDAGGYLSKLLPSLRNALTPAEHAQLIEMMRAVASATGEANDHQRLLIGRLKRDLAV